MTPTISASAAPNPSTTAVPSPSLPARWMTRIGRLERERVGDLRRCRPASCRRRSPARRGCRRCRTRRRSRAPARATGPVRCRWAPRGRAWALWLCELARNGLRSTIIQRGSARLFSLMSKRILLALVGALLLLRLPSLAQPMGPDQGLYAYVGERIRHGELAYRDAWDQKPPGIHYVYAALRTLSARDLVVPAADLAAAALVAALLWVDRLATGRTAGGRRVGGALSAALRSEPGATGRRPRPRAGGDVHRARGGGRGGAGARLPRVLRVHGGSRCDGLLAARDCCWARRSR